MDSRWEMRYSRKIRRRSMGCRTINSQHLPSLFIPHRICQVAKRRKLSRVAYRTHNSRLPVELQTSLETGIERAPKRNSGSSRAAMLSFRVGGGLQKNHDRPTSYT